MNMQKKRDFLTNCAYWAIITAAVYLGLQYLLPVSVPFILGILVAWLVIRISKKLNYPNRFFRIGLTLLIYGFIGLLISLLVTRGVTLVTNVVKWIPQVYNSKLLPFVTLLYNWCLESIQLLDPALRNTLSMVLESALSALKNLVSFLSTGAVSLVSGIATGIPNLVLSLLAMIFSTIFVVGDYEQIYSFTQEYIPEGIRKIITLVRTYLTDTLFVVIRSYILIMLLTFTELVILFSIFGIKAPILKAVLIAVMDILPILGTGTVMIPWSIISFLLGDPVMGIKLAVIYVIVTVVRNYVEPKVVGAQLGLHPVITLAAMFIGLQLSGILAMFGLPVAISFIWKQRQKNNLESVPQ